MKFFPLLIFTAFMPISSFAQKVPFVHTVHVNDYQDNKTSITQHYFIMMIDNDNWYVKDFSKVKMGEKYLISHKTNPGIDIHFQFGYINPITHEQFEQTLDTFKNVVTRIDQQKCAAGNIDQYNIKIKEKNINTLVYDWSCKTNKTYGTYKLVVTNHGLYKVGYEIHDTQIATEVIQKANEIINSTMSLGF
jgi:hypothetical protein